MKYLSHLFEANRRWAQRVTHDDPDFFEQLSQIQRPEYLWIGCSDSRVPANQIVGLRPGEMFVHRNVANLVDPKDPNGMSAIEFAIGSLGVRHVIVCGHYGCGGVRAALEGSGTGCVREWLDPLTRFARTQKELQDDSKPFEDRWNRLCELSVIEQVKTLVETDLIRNAWRSGVAIDVHGWIYSLRDGLLKDLGVTTAGENG